MTRRILIAAASALGALLLGELALRLFAPQLLQWDTTALWAPARGVGWRQRPNVDVIVNTGERDARVLTDAAGHRVGAAHTQPADIRILAIGDSMVEAVQVDDDQTMTALAARGLSAALGRSVDIVNAGVGGWDPNQYLAAARAELSASHYDLVLIFVYLENDIVDRRIDYPATSLGPRNRLVTLLGRHSHLFVYLYNLNQLRLIRSGNRPHLLTTTLKSRRDAASWRVTADLLGDIAAEGARVTTPVIFVLLPPVHYIDARLLAPLEFSLGVDPSEIDIRQPAARLSAELAARHLTVFDATPDLQRAFDAGDRALYGRVDRHFSPAGHRVVARFLEQMILSFWRSRP